uniref:Uncharacterized protein n=1 Tax=Amphimedon queenslandica TaxID=400682 RepID=A0A1X7U936_AMPQE
METCKHPDHLSIGGIRKNFLGEFQFIQPVVDLSLLCVQVFLDTNGVAYE